MASLAISLAVGASQHEIDARAKAAEERAQQQASKQALRDEKEAEVSRIDMLQLPPGSDPYPNPGVVCERQCAKNKYHTTECATGFCGLGFCPKFGAFWGIITVLTQFNKFAKPGSCRCNRESK